MADEPTPPLLRWAQGGTVLCVGILLAVLCVQTFNWRIPPRLAEWAELLTLLVFGGSAIFIITALTIDRRRARRGRCAACGYPLRKIGYPHRRAVCPECGFDNYPPGPSSDGGGTPLYIPPGAGQI
jgi:hypothetical protein